MWRTPAIVDALKSYACSSFVGKIILIDNDASRRPDLEESVLNRLTIINHGRNIFVNPAWNEGVSLCESEIICIANDDIFVDEKLFQVMISLDWESHGIDIIGLGLCGEKRATEISRILISKSAPLGAQVPTFGACMFMPRNNYVPIPEQLKIWYGDDYLARSNPNAYVVKTSFVTGRMSATIRSFDPDSEIYAVIRRDIDWAKANLLDTVPLQDPSTVSLSALRQHGRSCQLPLMAGSPASSAWDGMAQQLWEQGQQQAAIDRLLLPINAAQPAIPRRLGLQLVYYIFQLGDLPGAELFLRQLLQVHPEDLEILENLAAVLSRQKKATEAVSILEQVVARSPGSANAWDGLAASLAGGDSSSSSTPARGRRRNRNTRISLLRHLPGPAGPFLDHQRLGGGDETREGRLPLVVWRAAGEKQILSRLSDSLRLCGSAPSSPGCG